MIDPLSRALDEAPEICAEDVPRDVASYRTDHAPPLGCVLDGLRVQLIEAMSLPFFDGGANVEVTPVTKRALSEAGAATIVARKREPALRSDHRAGRSQRPRGVRRRGRRQPLSGCGARACAL